MVGGEATIGEAGVCCLVGGGVNKGPDFVNLVWFQRVLFWSSGSDLRSVMVRPGGLVPERFMSLFGETRRLRFPNRVIHPAVVDKVPTNSLGIKGLNSRVTGRIDRHRRL
jgi:hypothetical protein